MFKEKSLRDSGGRQALKTRLCAVPAIKELEGFINFLAEPQR